MTRMWLVEPELMCREHLLGEHNEIHKLLGGILYHPYGLAILKGQVEDDNVDVARARARHDELVVEMKRRGYNHDDAAGWITSGVSHLFKRREVSVSRNLEELADRCEKCRSRIL